LIVGVSYANGLGVRKDQRKAVLFWEKAAAQGLAQAQYNLGMSATTLPTRLITFCLHPTDPSRLELRRWRRRGEK
jgi:TPR repeat protein